MGKVALNHNRFEQSRKEHPSVEPTLTKDNVILIDEIGAKTEEEYINEYMQPFIDEYNNKQKRKDRKINENYVDYWRKSEQHNKSGCKSQMMYEFVLQVGNHKSIGQHYYETEDMEWKERLRGNLIKYYQEALKQFQEAYPHLKVVSAVIHFDEPLGTPHMHIDVIGLGTEYKRGLSTQISIGRALEQDGVKRIENMTQEEKAKYKIGGRDWEGFQITRFSQDVRHDILNEIAKDMGLEVDLEETHGLKHQSINNVREEVQALYQGREDIQADIKRLNINRANIQKANEINKQNNDRLREQNQELRVENNKLCQEQDTLITENGQIKQETSKMQQLLEFLKETIEKLTKIKDRLPSITTYPHYTEIKGHITNAEHLIEDEKQYREGRVEVDKAEELIKTDEAGSRRQREQVYKPKIQYTGYQQRVMNNLERMAEKEDKDSREYEEPNL